MTQRKAAGWLLTAVIAVGAALWAGAADWITRKVPVCIDAGFVDCIRRKPDERTLYLTNYYGSNSEGSVETPLLSHWLVKLETGEGVRGTYDGLDGMTTGSVTGFQRDDELVLLYSGKGYGSLFLRKREFPGRDPVYVGYGFVYACMSTREGTCDQQKSQHKICRSILASFNNAENNPDLKQYLDAPCIAISPRLEDPLVTREQN